MSSLQKRPLKVIEIPLTKFNEEVIPHHKKLFESYEKLTQKLISSNKTEQLKKELKEKKHVVRQLKDLLYELDTLRTQVEDVDLDKFDDKTFSLRKIINNLIKEYANIEKQSLHLTESQNQINENIENESPFRSIPQIQMQENLTDLKLSEAENRLRNVEAVEAEIQDIHELYADLHEMVHEQSENIDIIDENVETTKENVDLGLKSLVKASRLKATAYPITGAFIGTLVGGPIGLVAGIKIGSLAAVSCGVAGYVGGKFFKKVNETEPITEHTNEAQITNPNDITVVNKDK